MAQRIQQGSILGFVLVGALLTALVIGGIFIVRNQLSKNGTQNPGSSQVATDKPGQATNNDATKDKSDSDSLKQALDQQRAEEKKAQEQKAASEAQSGSSNSSGSSSSTAANSLPATGPADAAWTVLGATMLAGAGIAYVRSRSLI